MNEQVEQFAGYIWKVDYIGMKMSEITHCGHILFAAVNTVTKRQLIKLSRIRYVSNLFKN